MHDSVHSASYSSVCNMYCVSGGSRTSLLVESTDSMIYARVVQTDVHTYVYNVVHVASCVSYSRTYSPSSTWIYRTSNLGAVYSATLCYY